MAEATANGYADAMEQDTEANRATAPPEHHALLEQTAKSNAVALEWDEMKEILKTKLADAISDFLSAGPPWPLAPEEALQARERAYDTLDSFSGPPFTIQRFCELSLYPRKNYNSLPKYLRAVNRILSVTSEQSMFPEDEEDSAPVASTSATTLDTTLGLVGQGMIHPPAPSSSASPIATRRPSASPSLHGSPRSSPQVVPLLSPIPWLRTSDSASENGDVDSLHLSSPKSATSPQPLPTSLPSTSAAGTDLHLAPSDVPDMSLHAETSTPTGGLVDEVDPGSGGSETAEPVALSGAMRLSPEAERPRSSDAPAVEETAEKTEPIERAPSLAERFTRASSPKVEMPLDPEKGDTEMSE